VRVGGSTVEERGLLSRSQYPGAYVHNSKVPGLFTSMHALGHVPADVVVEEDVVTVVVVVVVVKEDVGGCITEVVIVTTSVVV